MYVISAKIANEDYWFYLGEIDDEDKLTTLDWAYKFESIKEAVDFWNQNAESFTSLADLYDVAVRKIIFKKKVVLQTRSAN